MSDVAGRVAAIWLLASALAAVAIAAIGWHETHNDQLSQPPAAHPVHLNPLVEAAALQRMRDDLAFGVGQDEGDYNELWEAIDALRATPQPSRDRLHR